MWTKYKHYILIGTAMVTIGILETMKPKETVWVESYSQFDKVPYGNYILFSEIGDLFNAPVVTSFQSLNASLVDSLANTNLIIINNSFDAEVLEVNALLRFVGRGNQAMIISRKFSDKLLDTLDVNTSFGFAGQSEAEVSYHLAGDTTQFSGPVYNLLFRSYFDSLAEFTPLGYRSDGEVNFLSTTFGEGTFFLHTQPSAFTNIFMLTDNNDQYVSAVLSHLPNQYTIWDEYYKARKQYIKQTPLQQVLQRDGLRQALYLLVLGTLTYMAFASKRKQRVIPVVAVKSNDTVEFIETMGQLYYNESDHKDIGMKRLDYFLSDIRERYRIDTTVLDEAFVKKLSTLSGVSLADVDKLIINFNVIKSVKVVLDDRIMEQDKLIKNYYDKEGLYGK